MQEYSSISSLSDAEVQYLDKQKIQDLVGGSIYDPHYGIPEQSLLSYPQSNCFEVRRYAESTVRISNCSESVTVFMQSRKRWMI